MRTISLSFLLFYYFIYHTAVVSAKCLQDQQSLLLQLKNNLIFNPQSSTQLKFWNETIACCNWNGVTCDNEGHVIGLDLSEDRIYGGFDNSSSLFSLQYLQKLDLSYNNFNSTIPSGFSKLVMLNYLDLSYASFVGQIPMEISRLTRLVTLNLSSSYRSSNEQGLAIYKQSLQTFLQNLTSLRQLYLDGISILATGHEWRNALLPLCDLQELSMSDCGLSGPLNSSLTNLTHLTFLDLSRNNLSGEISSSFFTLPSSLEEIGLSFNRLNGSLQLYKILKLRNLTSLDLSYNNISIDVSVANVDLSLIPNFTYLRLASCNLKLLPSFLINQTRLNFLDLSNNQIQGKIPNFIWKLQDLQILNMSHNFLTNLEGPFQSLTSKLEVLVLRHNKLQGSIPAFFKHPLFLDYSYNNFSVVPQYIGSDLSSMIFLSFSNNNLHGSIPEYLCNASQLEILDISFNNFSGTIPPCLITMTKLTALNVGKNILTGPIPDMFHNNCAVTRLNFHGNQLQGPIPRSLSNCSLLELLDIGSNQIVDHFPCILNDIHTLSVLVLRNNKFHGSIECQENKPWKSIQIVDIAFNKFNGMLPKKYFTTWERMMYDEKVAREINYNMLQDHPYYHDSVTVTCKGQPQDLVKILTIFKAIDFSFNFFEGPIPESLMDFKSLIVLNFSNNGLTGEIPSSIGNMKQLESLDFSNNSFVGEIPVELASLSFLSYLNLSINHLVGKIPTGTQLQSFQASSFEGNDGLYGPPLDKMPDGLHPKPACEKLVCSIDWAFLSVELGFIFGLGTIICPVMFWKKWRVHYWKLVDKILCRIFPRMHLEYATHRGKVYTVLRW